MSRPEVEAGPHEVTPLKHPRCQDGRCDNPAFNDVFIVDIVPRHRMLCSGHTEPYREARARWNYDQDKERRQDELAARRGTRILR